MREVRGCREHIIRLEFGHVEQVGYPYPLEHGQFAPDILTTQLLIGRFNAKTPLFWRSPIQNRSFLLFGKQFLCQLCVLTIL